MEKQSLFDGANMNVDRLNRLRKSLKKLINEFSEHIDDLYYSTKSAEFFAKEYDIHLNTLLYFNNHVRIVKSFDCFDRIFLYLVCFCLTCDSDEDRHLAFSESDIPDLKGFRVMGKDEAEKIIEEKSKKKFDGLEWEE